jgi:hypothetical protein
MRTEPLHVVSRRLFLTVSIYEGGRRSETKPSRVELLCVKPPRVEPCRVIVDTLSSRLCPRALLPVLETRQQYVGSRRFRGKIVLMRLLVLSEGSLYTLERVLPVVCE